MSSTGGSSNGQDPFSYLNSAWSEEIKILDSFSSMFGLPSMIDLAKRVHSLPPEQRFTNVTSLFAEQFGIENADEADLEDLPENITDGLPAQSELEDRMPSVVLFLNKKIEQMEDKVIDNAISDREHERGYLILLALLSELSSRFSELYQAATSDESKDTDQLLSESMALNSWLILAAAGEVEKFDEKMLRDIFYARYYKAKRKGHEPQFEPSELEFKQMWRKLVIDGVVTIYDRRDISVSRGAELANVSIEQFEQILEQAGLEPNYGPESGAELNDGPTLSK